MRALLTQRRDALEAKWLCAGGFVRGGRADAHILTAQLIADWTAKWGEPVMALEGRSGRRVRLNDPPPTLGMPSLRGSGMLRH